MKTCCICQNKFEGWGNNPEGAAYRNAEGLVEFLIFNEDDCCCDECNQHYVIPGRLYKMIHHADETAR